jgi:hypothetical protein
MHSRHPPLFKFIFILLKNHRTVLIFRERTKRQSHVRITFWWVGNVKTISLLISRENSFFLPKGRLGVGGGVKMNIFDLNSPPRCNEIFKNTNLLIPCVRWWLVVYNSHVTPNLSLDRVWQVYQLSVIVEQRFLGVLGIFFYQMLRLTNWCYNYPGTLLRTISIMFPGNRAYKLVKYNLVQHSHVQPHGRSKHCMPLRLIGVTIVCGLGGLFVL